jgi:hypothetical protein
MLPLRFCLHCSNLVKFSRVERLPARIQDNLGEILLRSSRRKLRLRMRTELL